MPKESEETQKTMIRLPRSLWLELHRIVARRREERERVSINQIMVQAVEQWIAAHRRGGRS